MISKGRWCRVSMSKPDAVGRCDISGMMCKHADLVKQMEYRGSGLIWTGLWVYKGFADKPNPQGLSPLILGDPKPIDHPRPGYPSNPPTTL